jgi:hypothetical protein
VVGREIAVKKYVVRLSAEERADLEELIRKGKRSAQLLSLHPAEGGRRPRPSPSSSAARIICRRSRRWSLL